MKTIEWTAKNGTIKVIATITADYRVNKYKEILDADGWKTEVEKVEQISDINMITKAETMEAVKGTPYEITKGHPAYKSGAYAMIGDKIGLKKEVYEKIQEAIEAERTEAEMNASEEWQAMQNARIQKDKGNQEYDKHRAMMKKVMGY